MYRAPSRRHKSIDKKGPNLVPILDSVFILIFFLLFSIQFIKMYEVPSDVPLVTDAPPPKKPPLALTLKIKEGALEIYTGVPARIREKFGVIAEGEKKGEYDLERLHNYLVTVKEKHPQEKSIIFEPLIDIDYEKLVFIMDAVRVLDKEADPPFYEKDEEGVEVRSENLFNNIIFGNIQS